MSKVVIYARYSSHKQREVSIESQIKECRKFAEEHEMTVINEYVDRAITGWELEHRQGLQQLLSDSKLKGFTAVIVWKQDRLSRDPADFFNIEKQLRKNGVAILYATESNTGGASGVLNVGVKAAVNAYYSADLSEKVTRDMKADASKGLYNGSYRTYGYDITGDRKYVVNEKEAAVVKMMFNEYAKGTSNREIIDLLNSLGYKTAVGKPFTHDYLSRILHNEKYIGRYRWDEIVLDNFLPPLIDYDTFMKVQLRLSHNRQTGARANADVNYALIGKVYCGECGEPMVADCSKKKTRNKSMRSIYDTQFSIASTNSIINAVGTPSEDCKDAEINADYTIYRYYCCNTIKHPNQYKDKPELYGKCNKDRVNKNLLERKVVEFAATQYLTDENIDRLSKATAKLQKSNPSHQELKSLTKAIDEERKKINNLMDMIEQGYATKTAYERVAQAEARIEVSERSIAEIKAANAPDLTVAEFKNKLISIREKMKEFISFGYIPDNVIKEFCDIFIAAVYVYNKDDNGRTRCRIIFDELETDGLVGFNEADVDLSSTIDFEGSPKSEPIFKRLVRFFLFIFGGK